jgi:hypothetical protein
VLSVLGELVLSGVHPAPGVLRHGRQVTQGVKLFGQVVPMGRAGGLSPDFPDPASPQRPHYTPTILVSSCPVTLNGLAR